jgi:hypothetical protein
MVVVYYQTGQSEQILHGMGTYSIQRDCVRNSNHMRAQNNKIQIPSEVQGFDEEFAVRKLEIAECVIVL